MSKLCHCGSILPLGVYDLNKLDTILPENTSTEFSTLWQNVL